MGKFITRAYNDIEFNEQVGTITKYSSKDRLYNEIQHYKNLPEETKIWFPRLVSAWVEDDGRHALEIEAYGYDNLGKYMLENSLSNIEWTKVAKLLLSAIEKFENIPVETEAFSQNIELMYRDKTITEYKNLKNNFSYFNKLCLEKKIIINEKEYSNFEQLWSTNETQWLKILYANTKSTFIHGDLCFSNILFGKLNEDYQVVKFVDPRGRFGKQIASGDVYYDLAKLMHSTDAGYEYFINNCFEIKTTSKNQFKISYDNTHKEKVNKIFIEELYSKYDMQKIALLQGLIYVGMCARHYDSHERQLAMYLTGIKILNELSNNK